MYRAPPAGAPLVVAIMYTRIVGFDRRSGAHAWMFDAGGVLSRIEIVGDRIYAGGTNRVVCLHYLTGTLVWSAPSPVRAATFLVDGDEIFVGSTGEIAAFSTVDGRLLWHDPLKGWGHSDIGLATPGNAAQVDHRD